MIATKYVDVYLLIFNIYKKHLYSVIKIIIGKHYYNTSVLTVAPNGITIDICMQLIVRINIYLKIINMKLFHTSRLFYESRSE